MMDLKHSEFIISYSTLVGVHGCLFEAIATKKTSMDSNEGVIAYYELRML